MSLTPSQIRAAELLSKGHSHQEVGDAVGVSRRTILRWLKQEDFKNLSFGLVGRASQQAPQQAPQRSPERHSGSLTPQDLVPDALAAVQGILTERACQQIVKIVIHRHKAQRFRNNRAIATASNLNSGEREEVRKRA